MNSPRTIRRSLIATAVACCFGPSIAHANPVGPTVTHGQASFSAQGNLLTVTNSPGSIIHWQGFSIGAGETTRFVQQSTASAVLNRVVGGDPSAILGALQSNGRVWLINPNGILFGPGAQINTAGFVASTLNVMNADFLMGRMRFVDTPDAKSISNAGEIRTPEGGRVVLISPQGVENSGIIHSPKGEVILAAGKTIEIADSANPEVRIEVAAPDAQAINLGKIIAESGKIGIYGGIVANRGLVSADSAVVGENGKIVFRATRDANLAAGSLTTASGPSGGTIEVSSEGTTLVAGSVRATGSEGAGGQVRVLGQHVGLIEQASVDASGSRGGGTVLVGGDLQGTNPAVQNAQMTYVGSGTNIKADAVSEGNGGKVIVWADDTTRSHGAISARGGARGGDGGFVETSGKVNLSVTQGPDVRAPAGKGGTWLIDPNNIEIVAGQTFDATTNSGAPFFSPLADGSVIGVDLINAQLDIGSNVVINTTSRGATAGTDPGNITLSAAIVKTAATTAGGPFIGTTSLTLQAHNDIVVNAGGSITSTGDPLNVTLIANAFNTGGGAITLGAPITTRGGSVTLQSRDALAVNAPIHTLNASGFGGGFVSVNSTANAVNLASTITSGSNVFVQGLTGVNVTAPVTGNFFTGSSANGPVVIGANVTTTGGMTLNGSGVTVASGVAVNTGFGSFTATDTSPATFNLQAGASITSSGATVISDNMQIDGTLNAGAGSVTLRQNTAGRPIFLGAEAAGGVALAEAELHRIATTGPIVIGSFSTGPITINAPINVGTVSSVSLQTASTVTQNAGASVVASMPVSITAPAGATLNAPLSAPSLTVTSTAANSTITQNAGATLNVTGNVAVNANSVFLNAPVTGSLITVIADTFAPNAAVTSGSDIDVRTSTFGRAINLGVGAPAAGSLDLTNAQLNNLITAPTGVLRIGTTSSGAMSIQNPIAPAGTGTLRLASNSSITQAAGATITETNLGLQVSSGNVNLPEANVVGTLAGSVGGTSGSFTFQNAPSTPLTIGTVDFINGVSNFFGGANSAASFTVDALTVVSPVSFFNGTVAVRPVTAANKVDLGGADAAGILGLSQADLGNVFTSKLTVKTDQADISAPIAPAANGLNIVPITAGRILNVVTGAKNPANLEFVQADINNVTVGTLQLGDGMTGPANVNSALVVPNTIGTFALQSGDLMTGITVNAALSATNNVSLIADRMTLNAVTSTTNGSLFVQNSSAGTLINLGTRDNAKLSLSENEIETRLSAPMGTINLGSSSAGNLDVTAALDITGAASFNSGGVLTVTVDPGVTTAKDLTLNASRITLNGKVTSTTGHVTLIGDRMDINDSPITMTGVTVSAPMGDINAFPRSFRSIDLGSDDTAFVLGFTSAELDRLKPLGVLGVLRIGDLLNTGNITITGAIAPANATTLSLITANGSITQTAGSTIAVTNLAARAGGFITLDENNDTDTFAGRSDFGNVNITYFGNNPLNIGTVDALVGVQAPSGNITLRSDELNINQRVDAGGGFGTVTIVPVNANQMGDIGSKPGGVLGLTEAEFNRVGAGTLVFGLTSTGNVTVSAPVNMTGGVNDLLIRTGPAANTAVNAALTVPGNIDISTGTITTAAALTSTFGAINLTANAMTFGALVSAGAELITLKLQTPGMGIAVGGADSNVPLILGLDATDLGNLSYGAGTLAIGNTATGSINVTFPGTLPGSVSLASFFMTFNSNFSTTDSLSITADSMTIPGANGISAPNGISINTVTAGRNITLGTATGMPSPTFELSAAELNKISISGTGTLSFDTSGSITTTAPLTFTLVPSVKLSAGTINHTGGALSAPDGVTFLADSMPAAGFSPIITTSGSRVVLAPRSFRSMNLGTNPAVGALGLTNAQIQQISTAGVVQLGDQDTTNLVTITAPISQPAGSSALTIASGGTISQTAGSTITASKLNLQTFGSVNLPENNAVGTLAGSTFGSFSFTGTGTLTIGTVDGMAGISDSTITLRSDGLNVLDPIAGGTTTLAPRLAGTAINLGGGAGYSITDAAVDLVTGFTLNIGDSTSGPINVVSAVDRAFGSLNLNTAPGNTITVSAPLGSATTSSVSMNSGLGGTVNIGGAVSASGFIAATGRNVTVNAPVTSSFSNVTLGAAAGDTGSVVTVNQPVTAFNTIRLTADTQNINAALTTTGSSVVLETRAPGVPIDVGSAVNSGALVIDAAELARISTDQLFIGNSTSGPLTITSAIGPFTFDFLSLQSGGNISQLSGATVTLTNVDPITGAVTGSLSVNAGGKVTLTEANNIALSVSGNAGGTGNNFEFNNVTPLKLQNLFGVSATGKVIINSPPGNLVLIPPPPPGADAGAGNQALAQEPLISALATALSTQEKADKEADARKADGEKKQAEQDKEEGRKSCS